MTTITINTYDAASRFNMDEAEAKEFFSYVEKMAIESGHEVAFAHTNYVDEESEAFVESCFQSY
ncbi:TPA: hypothetical protein QHC21_000038 [Raoultella planticola]|nr:hypothetical protein [Klebsiella oxytoca]HBQ7281024.1 hypothetical protein [Klebsiella pneumoniae]HBU6974662.1 hypothetical protein [Raoultella planticola]HDT6510521.1 hypothetical protein [Klebsiella aerogenes]HDT5990422.1 hypothetical protein [Raoultella planticola]